MDSDLRAFFGDGRMGVDHAEFCQMAERAGIRRVAGMIDGNEAALDRLMSEIAEREPRGAILTHRDLDALLGSDIVRGGQRSAVGASSIDIHLGRAVLLEDTDSSVVVDYRARSQPKMRAFEIPDEGLVLRPGQFVLAHSVEWLNMPRRLSALLRTKSSMGRIGWEHMDAGWIDPGFSGALTLEYKNNLQYQSIRIRAGDPCGQLVFFRHEAVDVEHSYAARGRYNGSATVEQVR